VLYREAGLAAVYPHPFAVGPGSFFAWLGAPWSGGPRVSNAVAALRAREPAVSPRMGDDELTLLLDAQALAERYDLPDVFVTPAGVPSVSAAARSHASPATLWPGPRLLGPASPTLDQLVGVGLLRASLQATTRPTIAADRVVPYWYADTTAAIVPADAVEIWAPSTAAVARLAVTSLVPAVYVPAPAGVVMPSSLSRHAFDLADAGCLLVAVADPLTRCHLDLVATVQTFLAARAAMEAAATMVVAVPAGGDSALDADTRAVVAAAGLRWLSLPIDDLLQLLRLADAYVCLHDGVVADPWLAEALFHGCPAVVTHGSGTTDIATVNNSYLVATRTAGDSRPDAEQAIGALRSLIARPEAARGRGQRGRRDLRASHGLEAVATLIGQRLARIASDPRSRVAGAA
jgi:hypothetical protein